MNYYDLAKQYLTNPSALEYQYNSTKQELRQLLFLQSQKAHQIQQTSTDLVQSVKDAQLYSDQLKQIQQNDLQLVEQVAYSLNITKLTAQLLKNICMIPIKVEQLKQKLDKGGYLQVQQDLKYIQDDINQIRLMTMQYKNDSRINKKYVNFDQLQQVIDSFDAYFHSFDLFQNSMQHWLEQQAPSEILLQVSRGYEHFLQQFIDILIQQEQIEAGSLYNLWQDVASAIYLTIPDYFSSLDFENIDFKLLQDTIGQYFKTINEVIFKIFNFVPDKSLTQKYGTYNYSQRMNLTFHSHFPIKRVYICGIHQFLLNQLEKSVQSKIKSQQLSVDFIVKLFVFIEFYQTQLNQYDFNFKIFKPVQLLKLQQLQTDPAFFNNIKPFNQIQQISTGTLKGENFNSQACYSLDTVKIPLIEISEFAFSTTFEDFWNDKTSEIERQQIIEQTQCTEFFINGLNLNAVADGIESSFEQSVQQKFTSSTQVAVRNYANTLRSPQQLNNKFRTTIPADFSSIFNMSIFSENNENPQIDKLNFIVFQEACKTVNSFASNVHKKLDSSLPRLNFQHLIGVSDNQQFKNFFIENDMIKKPSNQNIFKLLLLNSQTKLSQITINKKQEINIKDSVHDENEFDNLQLNSLFALANDSFVFQQMLRQLSTKITTEDVDNILEASTIHLMNLIIACVARISYIIVQQNVFNYNSIKQAVQALEVRFEPICLNMFRQQFVKTVFGAEICNFLWKSVENKKLNQLDDNFIDIYVQLGKKIKEVEELCIALKIRQNDIQNCKDELQMFQSREINNNNSFLSICIYLAKNDLSYEDYAVQKGSQKIKEVQSWNFYKDGGVVERVVKKFIQ